MGLRLASGAHLPRRTATPELALAAPPRSRLWPILAGALFGSGFVIVEAGTTWATRFAMGVGALALVLLIGTTLVRRTLRLEGSTLVLEQALFRLRRTSSTLVHEGRVWIGSAPAAPGVHYPQLRATEVRVVGERGRLAWRVRGSSAAAREVELLGEFLPRAGVKLLGDDTELAGSIEVNHNAERTLLSWRAALPTTGRTGAVLLALGLVVLTGLTLVPGQSKLLADAELVLLSLAAVALAVVAVRARRSRTSVEVSDHGWVLCRRGLLRTHRYEGARALLPGRVVSLHGALPIERSLELADANARALDAAELSPPEMRWLAARVVDRLSRDLHSEPRQNPARLVI